MANRRAVDYADLLTQALREEKRELQASNAALEQYAYVSSHDLQTPLRSLRDVTDYLTEDLQSDHPDALRNLKVTKALADLYALIARMEGLVLGVLEFARVGRSAGAAESFDADAAIRDIVASSGIELSRIQLSGDFPVLFSNRLRFFQIVTNLLRNAAQHHHAPQHLQITIDGRVSGADYTLAIGDDGPGIDAKFHGKIFEMFQVLTPGARSGSTGIGLAIVRRAVDAENGTISVVSAPGQGARFTVVLPEIVAPVAHALAAE